jgi:hypothetical protein
MPLTPRITDDLPRRGPSGGSRDFRRKGLAWVGPAWDNAGTQITHLLEAGWMADDKKCFVIMPITVPPGMEDKYGDDLEHFGNVYECLFKPSVEVAGYVPIPPKAAGSENIQASIIKNLETADLVLCDMSCLNPNVFFEWGIRTSLNKPVCVVKDELTKTIPFDVGTLHCEDYSSRLGGWKIKKEREKLRDHLRATVEKSGGGNELWQHFGLKEAAQVFEPEKGENGLSRYANGGSATESRFAHRDGKAWQATILAPRLRFGCRR